jgi:hypothetical protein
MYAEASSPTNCRNDSPARMVSERPSCPIILGDLHTWRFADTVRNKTECWFQNSLPIPRFINCYGNLKIFLAVAFLVLVFYVVATCFMRPPKFQRSNAKRFSEATVHLIHQGNADRLQVVAALVFHSSHLRNRVEDTKGRWRCSTEPSAGVWLRPRSTVAYRRPEILPSHRR